MEEDLGSKVPSPELFTTLTPDEQEAVLALNSMKSFTCGHILIAEGQYPKESYTVAEGVVRQYKINEGKDITSNFFTEQESISTISYALKDKPSPFSLECLTDCTISVVSFDQEREMYRRFPRFEKMCRLNTEKELVKFQEEFAVFMSSSPEERYLNLLNSKPSLLERVPQYHLASYLGVQPESLSRIRKRIAAKK